jgi:DNA-binding response OmpR family regulator
VLVLIVEDDPRIVSFLERGLGAEGYATTSVGDGASAIAMLDGEPDRVDLVLLDLGLPGMDGEETLRAIRQDFPMLPVIILTARADIEDKVRGLNLGANDYVTKPFSFAELLARIRAALRTTAQHIPTELVVGDLTLDLLSKVATRGSRRIPLSPREWALLELFMRNPTHVISRARIASEVFGYDFDPGSNVVDVYVGYLRRKLNAHGDAPLILTIRGAGYRFVKSS